MSRSERVGAILELCDELDVLICAVRESLGTSYNRVLGEQGSLTAAQAQARSKRDQKRARQIQTINVNAMRKAADIRADIGS